MKKIFLAVVLGLAAVVASAQEDKSQNRTYLTAEQLPDMVQFLPAPPDTLGPAFDYDVLRYMWGKGMRKNKLRAAIAERDAIWIRDTLIAIMSEPFGMNITREETPEIYNLLRTGVNTIALARIQPKAHYMRIRPFVRYQEHLLCEWEEEGLAGEGSYPSGHTMRGWGAALILCEVNPAAANKLLARGWMYGESRVIDGAHWQSDVDAAFLAASAAYAVLQSCPEYRAQADRARAEFLRLSKKAEQK